MINRIKQIGITLVLIGAALGLVSCGSPPEATLERTNYIYDERVNLCFIRSANTYGSVLSHVPCTQEVLQLAGRLPVTTVVPVENPND